LCKSCHGQAELPFLPRAAADREKSDAGGVLVAGS
jgi:hypothetical protein